MHDSRRSTLQLDPNRCKTVVLVISGCLGHAEQRTSTGEPKSSKQTAAKEVNIPTGFTIPRSTRSPDKRYGVLIPDRRHYDHEKQQKQLVKLDTGRILTRIKATTGLESMNHGGTDPRWTEDSTGLLWIVGGKWFPRAVVYLKMADGKVAWQADLLSQSQQEMLRQTRAAAPKAYAAAVLENKETGEGFPEGFTIDVDMPPGDPALPLHSTIDLTVIPKSDTFHPVEAEIEATMKGCLEQDGRIRWSDFKILEGEEIIRRRRFFDAGQTAGGIGREIREAVANHLHQAAPEALAAANAYYYTQEGHLEIITRGANKWPESLAVEFFICIASNPVLENRRDEDQQGLPGFPEDAEIIASLPGKLTENGTVIWGELNVATGAKALQRKATVMGKPLWKAHTEILRCMEAAAPEALAAFRKFAATWPKPGDLFEYRTEGRPMVGTASRQSTLSLHAHHRTECPRKSEGRHAGGGKVLRITEWHSERKRHDHLGIVQIQAMSPRE